jgi:hypothetical protein
LAARYVAAPGPLAVFGMCGTGDPSWARRRFLNSPRSAQRLLKREGACGSQCGRGLLPVDKASSFWATIPPPKKKKKPQKLKVVGKPASFPLWL